MSATLRLLTLSGIVLFTSAAIAQRPPTTGGTGGSTGGSSTTRPPTVTPTSPTQQQQQQIQRPMLLMGDVVTADGSPIPSNVEIHRVCNGRDRREGYADSSGHFSLQLGMNTTIQDASSDDFDSRLGGIGSPATSAAPGMMGSGATMSSLGGGPALFGCELKATSAGFRSTVIDLSSYRPEDPRVGAIVLERLEKVQGTVTSVTSYAAPKDAQKALKKAIEAAHKGKNDEAEQKLKEATTQYVKYADAWNELGMLYMRENQTGAAENAFKQAMLADPKFVPPMVQLAAIEAMRSNWKEAAKLSGDAIALDPIDFPGGFFFNSVAEFNLGHVDIAEASARKAIRLDAQHRLPQVNALMGQILMVKKDYPGALENFRAYLQRSPNATDADAIRRQVQTLEQAAVTTPAPAPPQK